MSLPTIQKGESSFRGKAIKYKLTSYLSKYEVRIVLYLKIPVKYNEVEVFGTNTLERFYLRFIMFGIVFSFSYILK